MLCVLSVFCWKLYYLPGHTSIPGIAGLCPCQCVSYMTKGALDTFVVMDGTWVLSAHVLCMRNAQLGTCAPAKEVFMSTLRAVCSAHVNKMQLR